MYSPAAIVREAEQKGLLNLTGNAETNKLTKLRIRHSLARFSANHYMPLEGDGMVFLPGQAPIRGWLGRRWKEELY